MALSEVPESSEGRGALVMKIKHNLIDELKKLLFNNTSTSIGGGEEVRRLFNKFHDDVFKVRCLTTKLLTNKLYPVFYESWESPTELNPRARVLKWRC